MMSPKTGGVHGLHLDSPGKFKITGHVSVILVSPPQSSSNSIVHMHVRNHVAVSTNYSVRLLYSTHFMTRTNEQRVDVCCTYQISQLGVNVHGFRNVSVRFTLWDSFVKKKIPELASSQHIISRGNIFRPDKTPIVE